MIKNTAIINLLNKDTLNNIDNSTTDYTVLEIAKAIVDVYNSNTEYYNLPAQADDLATYIEAEKYLDELSNKN